MRIGQGYDLHSLEPGRPLRLGGVQVPHDKGLGHSDADVLAHAITDALLGRRRRKHREHFPDTDPGIKARTAFNSLLDRILWCSNRDIVWAISMPRS